jgi:hypothetical protein
VLVGHHFVNEWKMAWREILIGFTTAGIMWLSIVATSLIIHYTFDAIGVTPKTGKQIEEIVQFALDYTFFLNILFKAVVSLLVWFATRHEAGGMDHEMPGGTVVTNHWLTGIYRRSPSSRLGRLRAFHDSSSRGTYM